VRRGHRSRTRDSAGGAWYSVTRSPTGSGSQALGWSPISAVIQDSTRAADGRLAGSGARQAAAIGASHGGQPARSGLAGGLPTVGRGVAGPQADRPVAA
jgi:hypothetical protein